MNPTNASGTQVRVLTRRPNGHLDWLDYAEHVGAVLLFDGPATDACLADAELEDEAS